MKYTNVLNLPQSIVNAVMFDPYSAGPSHISATSLISPPRKRALERKHKDEITTDVADRIWSLYGQLMHHILERADEPSVLTERRLFIDRHGWTISGQFDRHVLIDSLLQDYKFTSVYQLQKNQDELADTENGAINDWTAQQNIYRLMLHEHGFNVAKMEVMALLRDWSKGRARSSKKDSGYPDRPAVKVPLPIWPTAQVEAYIEARLTVHGNAQHELPDCNDEERWCRPHDKPWQCWVVGNQRPSFYFATNAEATAKLSEMANNSKYKDKELAVEEAPAESKRCMDWCEAAPFCSQWKKINPNPLGV